MNSLLHVNARDATINYNTKIIMCSNGYIELKKYKRILERKKEGFEQEKQQNFNITRAKKNTSGIFSKSNLSKTRNTLIGYVSENEEKFYSFITLTFSNNVNCKKNTEIDITDIGQANKLFSNWCRQIRRKYPNFAYIGVPEYQKRGAVHYHILTSLKCGVEIPSREPKKTYNKAKNKWYEFIYYDIPYWQYGYSTALDLNDTDDNFNLSLYIIKYLYKDIDNRLFGRQKLMKSNNLRKPTEVLCNSTTYEKSIKYIKEKGYLISSYEFEPIEEFQIAFTKSSVKLSQEDYIILSNDITRATE